MDLDAVKTAIEEFADLSADASPEQLQQSASRALEAVSRECSELQLAADDYPANPIRADVWLDGAVLGPLAATLAAHLFDRGLFDLEEKAHTLRCMAVLAVQSHYHHIVGPAMLARGECNERLGDRELAEQIYDAVIADFRWMVDTWEENEDAPPEDERTSLECLQEALQRKLKLQRFDSGDLPALLDRCRTVLARS